MLDSHHDGLWTVAIDHSFYGLAFPARTTVLRLPSGGLWVHSPVPLTPELRAAVDELGPVSHIVCPNKFHHLYAGQWLEAYPDAALHGAPGLAEKRKDLSFSAELGSGRPEEWEGAIEVRVLPGSGPLNETVFFHQDSGTLIVTDLVLNIAEGANALTRFYLWAAGLRGKVATSPAIKPTVKDRAGARAVVDEALDWSWDRLIMAHGDVVESGGKRALRDALTWL